MEDMKLASITLRTNGTISDAINTYMTMGVPLSQLLTDYNDVITYPKAYFVQYCHIERVLTPKIMSTSYKIVLKVSPPKPQLKNSQNHNTI